MTEKITLNLNQYEKYFSDQESDEYFNWKEQYSYDAQFGIKVVLVLERINDGKWFKFEYYNEDLNFPLEGEEIFPYKIKQ